MKKYVCTNITINELALSAPKGNMQTTAATRTINNNKNK